MEKANMTLAPDDEAQVLNAIRRIPENNHDAAWQFFADEFRRIGSPSVFDVQDTIGRALVAFGKGRER
jgi:hypothetical protein